MAANDCVNFILELKSFGKIIQFNRTSTFDELVAFACKCWPCLTPSTVGFFYGLPGDTVQVEISSDMELKATLDMCFKESLPKLKVFLINKSESPICGYPPRFVPTETSSANQYFQQRYDTPFQINESGASSSVPNSKSPTVKRKLVEFWEGELKDVGQEFSDVGEFRRALVNFSICFGFNFNFVKNDLKRVTACCAKDGCPWKVHATRVDQCNGTFKIKDFEKYHSCGGGLGTLDHPRASKSWVSSVVIDKLKKMPMHRPTDMQKDIQEQYGLQIPYHKAWWGKEEARKKLHGDEQYSFEKLRLYSEAIVKTNPGSRVNLIWNPEDGRFEKFFVAYSAAIVGFRMGCRPLLFLDGTFLKSKYKGVLLGATGINGENEIFPLAFGIVDSETDDNWEWFLEELKKILDPTVIYTFISDRCKGLTNSISSMFPGHFHAYCLRHLEQNFKAFLSGQTKSYRNK